MSARAPRRQRQPAVLLALAALLAACGAAATGPPEVHWGVDECSHCHMILAEERFAAVARHTTGEEARFDDLECLVRFLADRGETGWTAWAHDAAGPGWLEAPAASYAATATRTPMGSGLLAFARPEAAAEAASAGEALRWQELPERAAAAGPRPVDAR